MSLNSYTINSKTRRAIRTYFIVLATLVILLPVVSFSLLVAKPHLFYYHAWEYWLDLVDNDLEIEAVWHYPSKGDLTRDYCFLFQKSHNVKVSTDSNSFRVGPYSSTSYPIVASGDSQIWGANLNDDETLPYRLALATRKPVLNGARYSIDNLLAYPGLTNVKIVLEMLSEINLNSNQFPDQFNIKKTFTSRRKHNNYVFLNVPLERYFIPSLLARRASKISNDIAFMIKYGLTNLPKYLFYHTHNKNPADFNKMLNIITEHSNKLRRRDIKYIFIAIPRKQTIYGKDYGLRIDDYTWNFTSSLARALSKNGVRTLDLAKIMRKHRDAGLFQNYDTHWNKRGVDVAIKSILEKHGDLFKDLDK